MAPRVLDHQPPPPDLRIPYGSGRYAFADLRLPSGPGPHPAAIALHGGYWRARYDLTYMGHLCAALAARGIATWNVEYRRIGNEGGGWPGTLTDVASAADALRSAAARFGLSLDQVIAVGHSAGGHLALWLAARSTLPAGTPLSTPHPLPLAGVLALAPVADLHLAYEWELSETAVAELLEGSPASAPERYTLASPAALLPLGVPQILLHGEEDDSVPLEMSLRYRDAAIAAGDSVDLTILAGGHFDPVDPLSCAWPDVLGAVRKLLHLDL